MKAARLVSVLENAMTNEGQISFLKANHRLGGWFPRENRWNDWNVWNH